MKLIALTLISLMVSVSSFAKEKISCGVTTSTTDKQKFDKTLFSGVLPGTNILIVKKNGEVQNKAIVDLTLAELKESPDATVVGTSVQDENIVIYLLTPNMESINSSGSMKSFLSLHTTVIGDKNNRLTLISADKNLAVSCATVQ
ncbi:MAG: hypothetical protein ACXVCP_12185 [Bdellovibrio sp.]